MQHHGNEETVADQLDVLYSPEPPSPHEVALDMGTVVMSGGGLMVRFTELAYLVVVVGSPGGDIG